MYTNAYQGGGGGAGCEYSNSRVGGNGGGGLKDTSSGYARLYKLW
jgi:hypothetical protein